MALFESIVVQADHRRSQYPNSRPVDLLLHPDASPQVSDRGKR